MAGTIGRKHSKTGNRALYRKCKTKRRTLDLDQIFENMAPEKKAELEKQAIDLDLPGFGQNYCVECAKHFITNDAKIAHSKTKAHKRRVRTLENDVPYTQKEAEAAAGLF